MEKIRKEFKFRNMNEVINFLETMELEKIVKNIEKTLGHPDATITKYERFGKSYRKESYVSEIALTPSSYDESFNANIRVKTENVRLIVLINYVNYDYNYEGNESDEKAILKIAYID